MSRSESLRERLALMKATLDREPVGIALLTYPELRYTYANPAMHRVLGTDPVGRLQDETCSDFPWPPRSRLKNVAERGSRLTSRDSRWVMPRVPGAPPEELFFTFEVSRVTVGQTLFLLATAVETTDEVEARKRIDGVVEQMQDVLDCVHESIVSLDDHWRLTFANKQAAAQFKRGRESLLHRSFLDLFGEYEAGKLEEALAPTMERRQRTEFELTLEDGLRYRVRAFPAKVGISVYMAPIDSSDPAGSKAAEETIQAVLALVGESITVFGGDMRITQVSDAACDFFGKKREELIGRTLAEAIPEHADHVWVMRLAEAMKERTAFRIRVRSAEGGDVVEHRGVPVEYGAVMLTRKLDA